MSNQQTRKYSAISDVEMENIIQALSEFKKTHVWVSVPDKKKKWIEFLKKISDIVEIERPKLVIKRNINCNCFGEYDDSKHRIELNKYSVITLLHEFYHAIHIKKNINAPHKEAWDFSNEVFFTVYPKKKQTLVNLNGVFLKRSTEGQ